MNKGIVYGFIAGLLVAIGGAIKDAPYEGFDIKKFIRSPLIGAGVGYLIDRAYPNTPEPLLLLSSIAGERIVVETYKVIRAMAGKYVPMKFIYGEWGVPKKLTKEGVERLKRFSH